MATGLSSRLDNYAANNKWTRSEALRRLMSAHSDCRSGGKPDDPLPCPTPSARSAATTCSLFCTALLSIKRPRDILSSPYLHVAALQPHPAQRAFAQEVFQRCTNQRRISLFIKGHEQSLTGQMPPP